MSLVWELPTDLWQLTQKVAGCTDISLRDSKSQLSLQIGAATQNIPPELLEEVSGTYVFVARELQVGGHRCDGVAYERISNHSHWIGLNESLLNDGNGEGHFGISRLQKVIAEEIVHVWDYRLEVCGSPFYSVNPRGALGPKWREVECRKSGSPKPFYIPGWTRRSRDDDQIAEDWATAVLWYLFQPKVLRRLAPERYEFVRELFAKELGISRRS